MEFGGDGGDGGDGGRLGAVRSRGKANGVDEAPRGGLPPAAQSSSSSSSTTAAAHRHRRKGDTVHDAIAKLREIFENKSSLRQVFLDADENRDGRVSASELGVILKGCGMHLRPRQVDELVQRYHSDRQSRPAHRGLANLARAGNHDAHSGAGRRSRRESSNANANNASAPRRQQQQQQQQSAADCERGHPSAATDGWSVEWTVRDGRSKPASGLPYDDFCNMIFVDPLASSSDPLSRNQAQQQSGQTRIQFLQAQTGNTVERLKALPARSLAASRIIDDVKRKVRRKIVEKRGGSLRKVFRSFDMDKDGQIDLQEMEEQISKLLGPDQVTPTEVRLLLQDLDADGDGTINIREFSSLLGDKSLGGEGTSFVPREGHGHWGRGAVKERRVRANKAEMRKGYARRPQTAGAGGASARSRSLAPSSLSSSSSSSSFSSSPVSTPAFSQSARRPSSAPRHQTNHLASSKRRGESPSKVDLKADRSAARKDAAKGHCLPPKGNIRELTFPFKDLYATKRAPSKRDHTPIHDTTGLIGDNTAQWRRGRERECRGGAAGRMRLSASMSGFSFNHQDRQRRQRLQSTKLDLKRSNAARIERNVLAPRRFEEEARSDRRVQSLIEQRLVYFGKLQHRFERDRAMQLAAGV
jgi:Ca2+-binding EF-hand superfamily protein